MWKWLSRAHSNFIRMNPPNGSSRASNPAPLLMAPATVALLQAHLPAGAGVQPEPRRHVSWAPLEGRRPPTRARWIPAGPEHSSSDDGCEADSTGCYMQSLDVDQLSRSSTILAPAVTRLAHHPPPSAPVTGQITEVVPEPQLNIREVRSPVRRSAGGSPYTTAWGEPCRRARHTLAAGMSSNALGAPIV